MGKSDQLHEEQPLELRGELPPGTVLRAKGVPRIYYLLPQGAVPDCSPTWGECYYAPSFCNGDSPEGPWDAPSVFRLNPAAGEVRGWICACKDFYLVDDKRDPWDS